MAIAVSTFGEKITEEQIKGLVGKFVHVPTNKHVADNPVDGTEEEVNVWFAGEVAGYEKAYVQYDFQHNRRLVEPLTYYNILLTSGHGYVLDPEASDVFELTEEEWAELLAEHDAIQVVNEVSKEIIVPSEESKIITPEIIIPGEKK